LILFPFGESIRNIKVTPFNEATPPKTLEEYSDERLGFARC
jgi:hypothetical protein